MNCRKNGKPFPRLDVLAYSINEKWSIALACVDKLPACQNGVKYFLVAVDVLSRKLRVQPLPTKGAKGTFGRMITKIKPLKV